MSFLRRSTAHLTGFLLTLGAAFTGQCYAQQTSPVIEWTQPAPILFPAPLSPIQLNARVLASQPVPVPMSSFYNVAGITTDGQAFLGGFDNGSWAYAEETLGASISWQNISFPIGPANAPDAVSGGTISLPAGKFSTLLVLGDLVNGEMPPVAHFTINYTDGTTQTITQSMSDWVIPKNYPGETLVECAPFRHNLDGSREANSVCVYGYQFPIDPTKTAASITLPQDRDVVLLSMVLMPPIVPGTLTYSPANGTVLDPGNYALQASFTPADVSQFAAVNGSVALQVQAPLAPLSPTITWPAPAPIVFGSGLPAADLDAAATVPEGPVIVPLGPSARTDAFYPDGQVYLEKGFDGSSTAFSAAQLGTAVRYAGTSFPLGTPAVPDAAADATITLPAGNYGSLYLIGAGANGAQLAQPFTVSYTDGSTSQLTLNLSAWNAPQQFAGETIVAATSYGDTAQGGRVQGTYDLYGYTLPIDVTRTVASLTLPPTTNVIILALGLDTALPFSASGNYVYTPAAGTMLPRGTNPLSVAFTPADLSLFMPAQGTTSIVVLKPTLTITANNATRVYGTANPVFTGSIMGALPGDVISESFSTSATTLSPAGNYVIVPSATGQNASLYAQNVVDGALNVTRAPALVSLTASASSVYQNQPVTLTAAVTSSTSGSPGQTVQFFANGASVGSGIIANGLATVSALLPPGTSMITAVYGGDSNFLPGTSANSVAITVAPADFIFTAAGGTTFNAAYGQAGTITLHVAPLHGAFAGNISFAMTGELPTRGSASFSPQIVPVSSGPADVVFTVQTQLLKSSVTPAQSPLILCVLLLPATLLLNGRVRRTRFTSVLAAILLSGLGVALNGCGSGYHNAQFPITVTAGDGTVQHTLNVTLNTSP